jgi:diguanylate cyclase (GGDEF)-like protein
MENTGILVIDDDSTLRKTLFDILSASGYVVRAAKDGTEGIALLAEHPSKLVLIDLGLPDISGMEVLRLVKESYPTTDAIILTGNATLDSAIEATNRGAFSYLLKPYDIGQLLLQIRRVTEKQAAEDEIVRRRVELEKINADLQVLYKLSQATTRFIDMDRLLADILQTLTGMDIFRFERRGVIFFVEEDRMRMVSHYGITADELEICRSLRVGECLCGLAAATGEIMISRNMHDDPRHTRISQTMVPHGHVVIPLKTSMKVVGVLCLYLQAHVEVDGQVRNLLATMGNQIGIAIENAKLYEETKSISLHDPLTGLANRRLLQIQLEKSLELAKRYGETFSVIMLDIDQFKKYNDTHGHVAGDELLVKLAQLLLREMRDADHVFRYGGEEFLVMLPVTDLKFAVIAAERLRKAVEEEMDITVSLGVASSRERARSDDGLINRADVALYRAKQNGRNRVALSSEHE